MVLRSFAVLPSAVGQRPYISISAVQTDKTKESMQELIKEYKGVVGEKPITAEELKDEQNNSTLALPGSFETVQQLSGAYANILQYGLPEDYYNTFTQKAMSLTPEAANEIAKKYDSAGPPGLGGRGRHEQGGGRHSRVESG